MSGQEVTVVQRKNVLVGKGATCVIGATWDREHEHPNIAECFEMGHAITRIDVYEGASPSDFEARFQHGENPEHTLVVALLDTPSAPCIGIDVDAWIATIHERAVPQVAHKEAQG